MTFAAQAQKRNFFIAAFLFAMACCNLSPLSWVVPRLKKGYQDFAIYYVSGRLLNEGRAAVLYDLDAQYQEQLTFSDVPIRRGALPFNHPPFEAVLFAPFAVLAFWPAYLFWTALNVAMLVASVALLRRFPRIRDVHPALLGLGVLAFFPLMNGLLQGQDAILLMFLGVLALTCMERSADAAAGACLALGLFRPHLVVPIVLVLAFQRWRLLLGFTAVALVLAGVGVAVKGWGWPLEYVRFVLLVEHGGSLESEVVPNIRGLAMTLVGHLSRTGAGLLIAASSLAVFVLAVRRIRGGNDSASYSFCLACVTGILLSFHALSYDLTLLLPLVLFALAAAVTDDTQEDGRERLLLVCVLFLTPLYVFLVWAVKLFFFFSLVILWLFTWLLRMRAPAAEPA
ncbi:MAG: glycosyltransferase family 87 protein [Terriglobales bacterium]